MAQENQEYISKIFSNEKPSLDAMILGLVADVASINQTTRDTNRRLDSMEKVITNIEGLSKQVSTAQNNTQVNAVSISRLETRCETIDRNVDALATHDIRIQQLEKDLIKNGELRMSKLESTKVKFFSLVLSVIGTLGTTGIAFFWPWIKLHFLP